MSDYPGKSPSEDAVGGEDRISQTALDSLRASRRSSNPGPPSPGQSFRVPRPSSKPEELADGATGAALAAQAIPRAPRAPEELGPEGAEPWNGDGASRVRAPEAPTRPSTPASSARQAGAQDGAGGGGQSAGGSALMAMPIIAVKGGEVGPPPAVQNLPEAPSVPPEGHSAGAGVAGSEAPTPLDVPALRMPPPTRSSRPPPKDRMVLSEPPPPVPAVSHPVGAGTPADDDTGASGFGSEEETEITVEIPDAEEVEPVRLDSVPTSGPEEDVVVADELKDAAEETPILAKGVSRLDSQTRPEGVAPVRPEQMSRDGTPSVPPESSLGSPPPKSQSTPPGPPEAEDFATLSSDELTDVTPTPTPGTMRAVAPGKARRKTPPKPPARSDSLPGLDEDGSPKRKQWWEGLFNREFERSNRPLSAAQVDKELSFIDQSLGLERGATVLDLACGAGRYAVGLSKRGLSAVGYDYSSDMLADAAALAENHDQKVSFLQGDMREMGFEQMFDGVLCWNASFGYFEEERNFSVLQNVFRALKPGGRFLLEVPNRDFVITQQPGQNWFETEGCICMDDMQVDFITSRMTVKRTIMLDDGRNRECTYSMRLYSLHELGRILRRIGFRAEQISGQISTPGLFFDTASPRIIVLVSKP